MNIQRIINGPYYLTMMTENEELTYDIVIYTLSLFKIKIYQVLYSNIYHDFKTYYSCFVLKIKTGTDMTFSILLSEKIMFFHNLPQLADLSQTHSLVV